jgi:hypothetical protein
VANDSVQYFTATLYFDRVPDLSREALILAWGSEGYECNPLDDNGVFDGLRGGTRVFVGKPELVEALTVPAHYPAVTRPEIDWAKTYYIDAKAAYDDLCHATHRVKFKFMIVADENDPEVAHNEIATTLLGIHQVAPMRAIVLHYLDVIVGKANLDDYLNYVNSHLDQPQQMATMLAFGLFVTEDGDAARAWTTGLDHFGQMNLVFDNPTGDATEALHTVFGLGYHVVHGRRFNAGETVTSFDLFAKFERAELDGKPMLRVVKP